MLPPERGPVNPKSNQVGVKQLSAAKGSDTDCLRALGRVASGRCHDGTFRHEQRAPVAQGKTHIFFADEVERLV